jgi:hypothetical protein
MDTSVEDARELLRREVAASSLNAVAARVGIDRSTLRTFVKEGGVEKPIGRVLEPILAYATRRLEAARTGEAAEPVSTETAVEMRAEMRGQIIMAVEWLHSLGDQVDAFASSIRSVEHSLRVLRASLDRATGGVARVVDSGALGMPRVPPGAPLPPSDPEGIAASGEELAQMLTAQRAAKGGRKRAAGE